VRKSGTSGRDPGAGSHLCQGAHGVPVHGLGDVRLLLGAIDCGVGGAIDDQLRTGLVDKQADVVDARGGEVEPYAARGDDLPAETTGECGAYLARPPKEQRPSLHCSSSSRSRYWR